MTDQKRITVYLEDNLWNQFNHIVQAEGLVKNTVLGGLCDLWVKERLREHPELALPQESPLAPLAIPRVQL